MNKKLYDLDSPTVADLLDQGQAFVVDVREPWEFITGRIEGCVHLPLSSFDPKDVPHIEGKRPIFYCAAGIRSAKAAHLWMELGANEAYHLAPGFEDWRGLGLPMETAPGNKMGMQRQIGWIAGVMLLVFTLLTLFVHPMFSIALFVMAASQLLLGMTGFCWMQVVLGQMPWNRAN